MRVAFLKSLEFLLDTLGCSLGGYNKTNYFPLNTNTMYISKILKSIIKHVYSTQKHNLEDHLPGRSVFNQTMKNIYNHFLESFLSVLSSISNQILLDLFDEVLVPTIIKMKFDDQGGETMYAADIFIYLLKITDKIINICQGDIRLNNEFLTTIFDEITKKGQSCTLHLAVQNLWQSLIKNVFSHYGRMDMRGISTWVQERIKLFRDKTEEAGDYELNQLNVIFDLITVLAQEKRDQDNK